MNIGKLIIKVPYCGDMESFHQIIDGTPIPIVAAGGPKTADFSSSLEMISAVMKSGAQGATIGRNVWGTGSISMAIQAFKQIIHDNIPVERIDFRG